MASKNWFEYRKNSDGSVTVKGNWYFILAAILLVVILCAAC